MTEPTRLIKVGTSGGKSTLFKSDASIQTLVAKLPIVASTGEQAIPLTIPASAIEVNICVNVIVPEVTGTTKTIDVGVASNGDQLIDGAQVDATGLFGRTGIAGEFPYPQPLNGASLVYQLGSADFVELEAEVIITFQRVE